ncbi:MAG: penicillin-binding protein beta-lactamase class [Mycobacterium sp.]|nr:penicillin-binding protein beta-lactamase class [Mycobacterium sp.]
MKTPRVLVVALVAAVILAPVAAAEPEVLKPLDPAHLQTVVEDAAREMLVPGAVVVVRTPQGAHTVSVGTTDLRTQTPPRADTHFRIASNTKTMTAALIVLMAQDGVLALDDPISAHVPGVPHGEDITLAHLLTMRSGLWGYTFSPELAAALDADPARSWTPQEVLALAYAHPRLFAAGTEYDYSNTNYALLGLVAEKVGGRPLSVLLHERLFGPLGLRQTFLPAATDTGLPAPYSHGYMYGGSAYALGDLAYPDDLRVAAYARTLQPIDYTHQNSSYATAAGGAVSTADDLASWIRSLVVGDVFSPEMQQQWRNSLIPEDPDAGPGGQRYGYGISYQRYGPQAAMYYHGGELPGFNSFMGHDPENDVTLVIWTNLTLSPDGRTTANAMLPAVLREIYTRLDF